MCALSWGMAGEQSSRPTMASTDWSVEARAKRPPRIRMSDERWRMRWRPSTPAERAKTRQSGSGETPSTERTLAHDLSKRLLLGAACRVAANDPDARVHKPVHELWRELEKRRAAERGTPHLHHLMVTKRWRGEPPADQAEQDEEEEDEASPVVPLPLDDRAPKEEPHGGILKGRYVDVEGAYWAQSAIEAQAVEVREAYGECTALACSSWRM